MKSLQMEDRNSNFDFKAVPFSDPPQIDSQKVMTTLRHRMAVQKALDKIKERIQYPPTLTELTSFSGLSRTYFSYVFKEVTGMRLQDYLIAARLDKAKELLNNIDLKIKQIAHKGGVSDPNYFCRTFKKKMGVSPTNWRLREIKNPC